jgi:MFS family permease
MDNLGAIAGPLLALGLVDLVGVRMAIALSVIPGLLAALAIVYAIRHAPRAEQRQRQPLRLRIRPVLTGRLGRLMVGVSAFEFGNVAATLLILRASELLAPGRDQDRATQLALGLYVAAATVASIPAGRLGDRRGAVLVLAVGVGLFGLAYAGFAAGPSSVPALAPWFVTAGVGIGCVETAEHAAVAALAPGELRGRRSGCWRRCRASATWPPAPSPACSGRSPRERVAFAYLVAWMLLALVGLLAAGRRPAGPVRSTAYVRRVGPVIRSPARLAVRFPSRVPTCRLVPASNANRLAHRSGEVGSASPAPPYREVALVLAWSGRRRSPA